MARAIDANELEMFPYSEGAGTEEQIADWIEQAGLSEEDTASRARDLCWKVIEGFINVVKTQPTLTPPNEPLTLEELLRMGGAPVWLDVAGGMWALVDAFDGCLWLDRGGSIDIAKFAGKAYRSRPPEGEEDT